MTNVAVLGVGTMGAGIAANLIWAGHQVAVWNRTASRAQPLVARGARLGAAPADAAAGAEIVFSVVGDDDASGAVWLGESGALSAMQPGSVGVECSTLSVGWVRSLHAAAAERGVRFVDAPLGGSKAAAEGGTLTLFIGGDKETVERLRPVLGAFANNLIHFGPAGAGATYKLINNMLGSIHLSALAEALALAERAGLDTDTVVQTLSSGAVSSPIVKNKIGRMVSRDYANPDFATQWMHKDVTYAIRAAEELGLRLALAPAAKQRFGEALAQGLGEADFAAVREVVEA
jgi:3-hydroxyisobutyrate dehydrogenase